MELVVSDWPLVSGWQQIHEKTNTSQSELSSHRFPVSMAKRKKFLGIEGEVVSCVSEIVLLFVNVSETQRIHVIDLESPSEKSFLTRWRWSLNHMKSETL